MTSDLSRANAKVLHRLTEFEKTMIERFCRAAQELRKRDDDRRALTWVVLGSTGISIVATLLTVGVLRLFGQL